MDFKNLLFAFIAVIAFNSCQEINPMPTKPYVVKGNTTPVPTTDTVYTTPGCSTGANLYVNGSPYLYLNYKSVNSYSDRVCYLFQDGLATVSVAIYMKPQKVAKKKFKIIPYSSSYNFVNYAQAMVVIYIPSLGRFEAKSGDVNFYNNSIMGFCGLQITNTAGSTQRNFDFTY